MDTLQFAIKVITLDQNTRNTLTRVVRAAHTRRPRVTVHIMFVHHSSIHNLLPRLAQSSRMGSKALAVVDLDAGELLSEQSDNQSEEAKAKLKAGRAKANEELKYLCREIETLKVLDHCACPETP